MESSKGIGFRLPKENKMFRNLVEKPLYKWWSLYQKKEHFTFLVQISLMLSGVFLLCTRGFFYKIHEHIDSSYTVWGWFGWYLTFGELLVSLVLGAYISLNVFQFFTRAGLEITDHKLSQSKFKDTEIVLKHLPAQKILIQNNNALKKNIINIASKKQVMYQAIETDDYFLGSYVLSINSVYRLIALFLGSQATVLVLGFFSKTPMLTAIQSQMMLTIALSVSLLFLDALISLAVHKHNNSKIKNIASRNLKSGEQIYCETELTVKPYDHDDFNSALVVGGTPLIGLASLRLNNYNPKDDTFSHFTVMEEVLNNINSVITTAYKAAYSVNNYDSEKQFEVDEDERRSHVKEILSTIDIYIPSIVKEIKESIKNMENLYLSDEKNQNIKNLSIAYNELKDDLLKQKQVLSEIINLYKSSFKDNTLSNFRNLIERRENGWKGDARFNDYSIKTQVLNKSLNENLIPELEHMMIGASDDEKELLLKQIDKIKTFFNEQVALDDELRSTKALNYDKSVSIDSEKVPLQTVNAVDNKVKQVDMYLNELKKNW